MFSGTMPSRAQKRVTDVNSALPKSLGGLKTRVGLVGEGTYPMVMGGVSTWYDQLLTGLNEYEFEVVTIVGDERTPRWEVPGNVGSVTVIPMWDPPPRDPLAGRREEERRVRSLLSEIWAAALPSEEPTADHLSAATAALRKLATANGHRLAATLARIGSVEAILAAWDGHRLAHPLLPSLSLGQAAQVAHLADRVLAVLDAQWPAVDLIHVSANGPSALIGLARHWRDGIPLILTEHGVYLRERYLALAGMDLAWPVRSALLGLIRLICQVTYAEAAVLVPVSDFNARWAQRLGADPERVITVHNGADVTAYSPIDNEPAVPTVSFVGRVDPLKDLKTMIEAFALVKNAIPDAKLRIFGPIPEQNQAYHADLVQLVEELRLSVDVSFEGRVPNARVAAEAGHVVALSSISEGLPFTVIEAMMCQRATVSTDVGGVSEITGRDGVAGAIVPPRDPDAMAEALVRLLEDDTARTRMGMAARERAAEMFSLDVFYRRIREIYSRFSVPLPPPGPPRHSRKNTIAVAETARGTLTASVPTGALSAVGTRTGAARNGE